MKYFFLLLSIFTTGIASSQNIAPCATPELQPEQRAFLTEFQKVQAQANLRGGATLYLPVKIHVVGTDEGTGYFEKMDVFRVICDMNEDFAAANIYFYLYGHINYINKTSYYDHDWTGGFQMMSNNNIAQAINIYFVSNASGACGYYSPFNDALAITKGCATIASTTLTHEMGHYLSMPHTFDGWEGHDMNNPIPENLQEKVDRSNCTTAGDGFCDTPSDFISDRWFCPYNGPVLLDPNGDTVMPDGTNYMSYSNDPCQDKFSQQQTNAMRAYITQVKNGIVGNSTNGFVPIVQPTHISPAQNATLPTTQVTLQWNKVPNATMYHVEVSTLTIMANKNVDVIITDTSYIVNDLIPNKNYKWRVKAMAPGNLCVATTTVTNFTTGQAAVGVPVVNASEVAFDLFPNPIAQNQQLNVKFAIDKSTNGELEVYAITGALLQVHSLELNSGSNDFTLDISGLSKGMYLIRWNSPEAKISKRFIVTE